MKAAMSAMLAGVSLLALGAPATAQTAQAATSPVATESNTLGEIVVTARRRSESLQEVPQTVNAVTADALQKLDIKQFQDIQTVVPGLSLATSAAGFQNAASLRGVTFNQNTGSQTATVAFYLNDAPVQLSQIFQSLFDIGQVEVLKGPQGTTRGVSAPSGAITVTTHKPDLSAFGGYADVTLTDQQGRNAQGAINIPIIKDMLAVRVAGVIDQNDVDDVRSLHSSLRPRGRTDAARASVSFEPSDLFNGTISYQHLDNDLTNFGQVSGPGQGSFTNPPLRPQDRAAVQDAANVASNHFDILTMQLDSRIFGQHLSYVGAYQRQKINATQESGNPSVGDVGNVLPGVAITGNVFTLQRQTTHEVRLASDPAPGRFIDYTVGAFYSWQDVRGHIAAPGPLLPGAFGDPALGDNLAAFNPAFQIPITIDIPRATQETSLFGSVTLHLGANTELSGGIRHIWAIDNNHTIISVGEGKAAVPAALFGGDCAALHLASTYPGFCDFVIPSGGPGSGGNYAAYASDSPNIYNVSLSHHVTRDLLVYANTGTSFRGPVASVGIQGALAGNSDPQLNSLSFHPAERSRAYEVGFKSTWLDGRARLNVSLFRQRFHNLTIYIPNVLYNNTISAPPQPTNFNFTASVDALVQGFDVDTALQISPEWNVSAQMSYADGKVKNSQVPCNITGPGGAPVLNTLNLISLCPGGSSSQLPLWNLTVQSEYIRPVAGDMDGFLRLLATYYPENKNRVEPNFTVDNYSLVNLYAGVRSHDGAWEAALFVRNAFNTYRALDISPVQANLNGSLGTAFPELAARPSGYFETLSNAPREVGVNVHYAWGSR